MLLRVAVAACLLLTGCAGEQQTVASETVLDCDTAIGTDPPPAGYQVVLGVVGLPASPGHPALQVGPSGDEHAPRLFAKTGLVLHARMRAEVIARDGSGIGWGGNPSVPARRVVVPGCPGAGWLAYAGGYWVDEPACVRIVVRAGDAEQAVDIGLGAACPGQQPPQE